MARTLSEGQRLLEKDPTLQRIVEVLDPDAIILFGSRARGDYAEESDYDLLVLKEGVRPEERRRLEVALQREIAEHSPFVPLDIVIQDTARFEKLAGLRSLIYYWANACRLKHSNDVRGGWYHENCGRDLVIRD